MKKHIISSVLFKNSIIQLFIIFNCLGCVTNYTATDIDEITDILVVEGVITDGESIITLSQSVSLLDGEYYAPIYIDNAIVYVECNDGMQWQAEPYDLNGRYTIKMGQLDLERKYCLKIEIDKHKYCSDFSYPIKTPEIDSVFWMKSAKGQPINIYVATHSADDEVLFYRWSYREDWEIYSEYQIRNYPYHCWNSANSRDILLGSAERTEFGQVTDKIFEALPSDKRWSILYRITVKQNAISKRAHDYFANIKKNAENIGSIFAPTPSELRGNIICITDPRRPVIGYIDISTITQKTLYISSNDVYEKPRECEIFIFIIPPDPTVFIRYSDIGYVHISCADCTYNGGTPLKPDDWPRYFFAT